MERIFWTPEEEEFIRKHQEWTNSTNISYLLRKELGVIRSPGSIRAKIGRMWGSGALVKPEASSSTTTLTCPRCGETLKIEVTQ